MTTDPIPLSLSWSSKCFKTHFTGLVAKLHQYFIPSGTNTVGIVSLETTKSPMSNKTQTSIT